MPGVGKRLLQMLRSRAKHDDLISSDGEHMSTDSESDDGELAEYSQMKISTENISALYSSMKNECSLNNDNNNNHIAQQTSDLNEKKNSSNSCNSDSGHSCNSDSCNSNSGHSDNSPQQNCPNPALLCLDELLLVSSQNSSTIVENSDQLDKNNNNNNNCLRKFKFVKKALDRKSAPPGQVFYNLLSTLPKSMSKLIGCCSEQIIDIMFEQQNEPMEIRAITYQAFLKDFSTVLENAWYSSIEEVTWIDDKFHLSDVVIFVEQYIGYWTYPVLFCHSQLDIQNELEFDNRLLSLDWSVCENSKFLPKMLRCSHNKRQINDLLKRAAMALEKMNCYYTPTDKLCSTVECLKFVSQAVQLSSGIPSSSDDLLTLSVYLISKFRPRFLEANFRFIQRFGRVDDLCMHSTGFSFTTLSIAIRRIWEMDGDYFGMTEPEFECQISKMST